MKAAKSLPEREIMTGIGPVARGPRVRDRTGLGASIRFSSACCRLIAASKSLEGSPSSTSRASTGDFTEAWRPYSGRTPAASRPRPRAAHRSLGGGARTLAGICRPGATSTWHPRAGPAPTRMPVGHLKKELVGLIRAREHPIMARACSFAMGPSRSPTARSASGRRSRNPGRRPCTRPPSLPKSQQSKQSVLSRTSGSTPSTPRERRQIRKAACRPRIAKRCWATTFPPSILHIRHRRTVRSKGCLSNKTALDGLQAHPGGTKQLAPPRRTQPVAQADRRCKVHRRHRSRQATTASRRLTHTVTKIQP